MHSPCPESPSPVEEGPIAGGPRIFSAGVLVFRNELKMELEILKAFSEITIRLILVQMALHFQLGHFIQC